MRSKNARRLSARRLTSSAGQQSTKPSFCLDVRSKIYSPGLTAESGWVWYPAEITILFSFLSFPILFPPASSDFSWEISLIYHLHLNLWLSVCSMRTKTRTFWCSEMVVGGWCLDHLLSRSLAVHITRHCHEDVSLVLGEVIKILVCYRIAIAENFTDVKLLLLFTH